MKEIFQFQPNPFTDFLTIKGESLNGQDFCIYNLLGQSLLKGKLNSDSNSLDLSHLESESVYILKIGNQINKLLKSH